MSAASHCLGPRRLRTLSARVDLPLALACVWPGYIEGVVVDDIAGSSCRHYRIDRKTSAVEVIPNPACHWTICP